MREKAIAVAARMLEANPDDVTLDDDGFGVAGVPGERVSWPELAAYAHEHDGGLGVDTDFTQEGATFPFGAHVAIVEVDTETGRVTPLRHVAVDDCGRILNPLIVAGQQHGGAIQGISQALWEEMLYDEQGTPITSSFADYAIPTAADGDHARGLQHRDPDAGEPDRRQGHRRVRDHRLDARGAERRRRRAQAPRGQAHRPARARAAARLARDPEPARRRLARAPGRLRRASPTTATSPTSSRPRPDPDRKRPGARPRQPFLHLGRVSARLPRCRGRGASGRDRRPGHALRREGRRRRAVADRRARHHHRRARPQRRRQDDHAGDRRGLPAPAGRAGPRARARPGRATATPCCPGSG